MAKLMILGGSNCQKNAFIAAERRGHETILVDYLDHPSAELFANVHEKISTFDVEACTDAARRHKVDGIFTIGTDQPIYTAAVVAQRLGLPSFISPQTALAATDKQVMKQILTSHGIPTMPYRFISRDSPSTGLNGLKPPLVLKPADSQGQRGIFKVDNPQSVFEHIEETLSFSRKTEALVEEYYPSDEITYSGWVQASMLHTLTVTDRLHLDDPVHIGICTGHRFPTKHMARYEDICTLAQRITVAFEIQNGPLYIQMLIGKQGIVVNELACRIGGAFEDVFIPYVSGFDILAAVIDGALGRSAEVASAINDDIYKTFKQVFVALLFAREGRIHRMTPIQSLRDLPFVLDAGYNFDVGQVVPHAQNATARFGHCVLASDEGMISNHVQSFYEICQVLDESGCNLILPTEFL